MSFQEIMLSMAKTLDALKDAWFIKAMASLLIAAAASMHGKLLFLFILLICFDLFARWVALSKKHLDDNKAKETGLATCILNINQARSAGYIKSYRMKQRFVGKFIWYGLICLLASILDINMLILGEGQYFTNLFVAYMGLSEAISILENFQEAGVRQAGDLLDLIKLKRGERK